MQIVGERRNIQNITKNGIHHSVHEIPQNAEWRVRNMEILTKHIGVWQAIGNAGYHNQSDSKHHHLKIWQSGFIRARKRA